MNELREQIEELHRQMLAAHPALLEPLRQLEARLLQTRDATLAHIKHIQAIDEQSKHMIAEELQILREVLMGRNTPPPIPNIEERYSRPRFLSEALQ